MSANHDKGSVCRANLQLRFRSFETSCDTLNVGRVSKRRYLANNDGSVSGLGPHAPLRVNGRSESSSMIDPEWAWLNVRVRWSELRSTGGGSPDHLLADLDRRIEVQTLDLEEVLRRIQTRGKGQQHQKGEHQPGEGPTAVTVRTLKRFDVPYSNEVSAAGCIAEVRVGAVPVVSFDATAQDAPRRRAA